MSFPITEFNATGPFVDAEVFAFEPSIWAAKGSEFQPEIVVLYYDADAAAAVSIYLATAIGAAAHDTIPIVAETLQHATRYCFPIPRNTAGVGVPFTLRITKASNTPARIRGFWQVVD